jgi:serine/threonine-protein kinase haspin
MSPPIPVKKMKPIQLSHRVSPPFKKKVSPRSRIVNDRGKPLCKPAGVRSPLSLFPPNVLSPHATIRQPKPRISGIMGSPFSPFVDMDIIVLDEKGRKVSQERRVGRMDKQVNSPAVKGRTGNIMGLFEKDVTDLGYNEEDNVIKAPKRRNRPIIVSDDEEEVGLPPSPIQKPKPKETTISKPQKATSTHPFDSKLRPLQSKSSGVDALSSSHARPTVIPGKLHVSTVYRPASPVTHVRQLTPVRNFKSNIIQQTISPASLSDISLSDLSLGIEFEDIEVVEPIPGYLKDLLAECEQERPHEFSAFIETFPFDPLVYSALDSGSVRFRKIGEASYSEVFGIGDVVLKVIPLRNPIPSSTEDKEMPPPSDAKDVWKEMIVTKAMGQVDDGFVRLLRGYIVKGRYPSLLLDLWDEYAREKGSEGIRPGVFSVRTILVSTSPNQINM